MKKNKTIIISFLIILAAISFYFLSTKKKSNKEDVSGDNLLSQTYDFSQEYLKLRIRTDNVLVNAENFEDYNSWNTEMSAVISSWKQMEEHAEFLEKKADASIASVSFFDNLDLISSANAYTRSEITNIYDKAPAGKKIRTLAKFLKVDAKRAFKILKNDQEQLKADAWNDAGDTFKAYEASAIVIKDGCKVAGLVGATVISGGSAGFMAASSLTQGAVIIGGADLVLEISDDGAAIAMGDSNSVSKFVGNIRQYTEPASSILTIASAPQNLASKFDKFSAVMFEAEQLRSVIQDKKFIGIDVSSDNKIVASPLDEGDIEDWLNDQGMEDEDIANDPLLKDLMKDFIAEENRKEEEEKKKEEKEMAEKKSLDGAEIAESEEVKEDDTIASERYGVKKFYGKNDKTYVSIMSPTETSFQNHSSKEWKAEVFDVDDSSDKNYQCYWSAYLDGVKKWENLMSCHSTRIWPYGEGALKIEVRVEFKKNGEIIDTITAERYYEVLPQPVDTYQYGQ